jgi:D-ribose pyranose/furanose isomerase RbsD
MRKIKTLLLALLFVVAASFSAKSPAQTGTADWQARLNQQLPLLGHRNWILIVDSAYPLQVSPGIETIETGAGQLEVTSAVLAELDHSIHVEPVVYLDAELPHVPEKDFAGLNAYREDLKKTLQGHTIQSLPHEQILGKISETAKTYKVLVLKTTMTMPYTSVFLQLGCKYWSEENEQKLRQVMKASTSNRR